MRSGEIGRHLSGADPIVKHSVPGARPAAAVDVEPALAVADPPFVDVEPVPPPLAMAEPPPPDELVLAGGRASAPGTSDGVCGRDGDEAQQPQRFRVRHRILAVSGSLATGLARRRNSMLAFGHYGQWRESLMSSVHAGRVNMELPPAGPDPFLLIPEFNRGKLWALVGPQHGCSRRPKWEPDAAHPQRSTSARYT